MKKIALLAILLGGLLGGMAFAQMPADMQNNPVPEGYYREHLALPAEIRALLDENKAKEAVAEYERFKKTAHADDLDMLMLDTEVYGSASYIEPDANYGKMREEAVRKMVEKYPNNAEVLVYTLPNDGNWEKSMEVVNKMIEVDPEYLPAYEYRLELYRERRMMMTKETCQDYMKLPAEVQNRLRIGGDCKALLGETENK